MATILPGPAEHCLAGNELFYQRYDPPDDLDEVITRYPYGIKSNCGDLTFSGHEIHLVVYMLMAQDYYIFILTRWVRYFVLGLLWSSVIIENFLIISLHHHYSIDMVVGIYISVLLYYVFMRMVPDPALYIDKINKKQKEIALKPSGDSLELGCLPNTEMKKLNKPIKAQNSE